MAEKKISKRHDYELTASITSHKGLYCLRLFTVWPKARTDRSPHDMVKIHLYRENMADLGEFIKEQANKMAQADEQ